MINIISHYVMAISLLLRLQCSMNSVNLLPRVLHPADGCQ